MNEDHQNLSEIQKLESYEDEIELIDILRVIWKWKYLIIVGIVICGVISASISLTMPKIYRVDMTIQPGLLKISPEGKRVYIDSGENIKNIIESNAFKDEILNILYKSNRNDTLKSLRLKASVLKGSNIINISCETINVDIGINILTAVYESLRGKFNELVKYYQDDYDTKIDSIKTEYAILESEATTSEQRVKRAQKRIKELETLINNIDKNNLILIRERNESIQNKNNSDKSLLAVLYNNTMQQNLSLSNQYRNDIKEYLYKIEEESTINKERKIQKEKLYQDINKLEFEKSSVRYVKILQSPTAGKYNIKPKTKLNVILALVVGLFLMIFLAFLLEYLRKYRKRQMTNGN
jgi:capsular polysaccharide biosynthesis protein